MADVALRGLPEPVHRALREAAERNRRSLNGEILARLEASVAPLPASVDDMLDRIRARGAGTRLGELSEDEIRELGDAGRA